MSEIDEAEQENAILRNLGLSILRATEAAALIAGRWVGRGELETPDTHAAHAVEAVLKTIPIDGWVVIGEEQRHAGVPLVGGSKVGCGGPEMDVLVDSVEGIRLLAEGQPDAVSVVGIARRGAMREFGPSRYLQKLVITSSAAGAVGAEALDAPPAWILGMVARALGKTVPDLTVFVLNRPRHQALITDLRAAGARVLLRQEGDVVGALLAGLPDNGVDILMGTGGTPEGLVAATALKVMGAAMYARLDPQSEAERQALHDHGYNLEQIYSADDLVVGRDVFFAATGISEGLLLKGVRYHTRGAATHSLVLNGRTGIFRTITAEHPLKEGAR
jgi:fructose-1,6-bisphosphatase II